MPHIQCSYRLPQEAISYHGTFCLNPRVHITGDISASQVCHHCQFRTALPVSDMRPLPRHLRQPKDIPACFFFGKQDISADNEFACLHPTHHVASAEICQRCADYRERLETAGSLKWAVGVTTAPRANATIARSLTSLLASGWHEDEIHLFSEPDVQIGPEYRRIPRTIRGKRVGAFPNWYLALQELYLTRPSADAFLLCQDDVVYCRQLKRYLEKRLWPAPVVGFASLYCGALQPRSESANGFFKIAQPEVLYGALAVAFPSAAVRAILLDPIFQQHREGSVGLYGIDTILPAWSERSGLGAYVHYPSLVGHIGDTSSIFEHSRQGPARLCVSFVGEEFDARCLISGAPEQAHTWTDRAM